MLFFELLLFFFFFCVSPPISQKIQLSRTPIEKIYTSLHKKTAIQSKYSLNLKKKIIL